MAQSDARVSPARWVMLAGFALLVASTQLLWLSFAPLTSDAAQALGVSEAAIGNLAVVNPLMFVILAIPAGQWLDHRFRAALAVGALLTAGGALLRLVDSGSFAWILAGQLLLSAGQPLVLNASTKIAARYFPPRERVGAISVAGASQFVGILAAAVTAPLLFDAGGLGRLLGVQAGVAVLAAVLVLAALRLPAAYATQDHGRASLAWLRHDRFMWLLGGLMFIGFGIFNAVATWLEPILDDFDLADLAGAALAVTTVAGIAGAAILPGLAAARDRRRTVLAAAIVTTVTVFVVVAFVHNPVVVVVALAVEGFALLASLPVALEWSELHAGPMRAGTATGFLLLAGNVGGVLVVLVVELVIGNGCAALLLMAVLALPGVLLTRRLPSSLTATPSASVPV